MGKYGKDESIIRGMLKGRKFDPYITHIRFPYYKNLFPDTRIDFSYPITAIVGANGSGKSSIIRALYGSPGYNNLGNIWFSTQVDTISEPSERSCFIYGYYNDTAKKVIEILKTRISKDGDPDYWEPSRPIKRYRMDITMPPLKKGEPIPLGRSKTRWDTIKKNVVYLDFRQAISAFDKFFYYGELRGSDNSYKSKKEFIRKRAKYLIEPITHPDLSYYLYGKNRIINKLNKKLSPNEVGYVSQILGREYKSIKLLRHNIYNCDAYTCHIQHNDVRYSEAFAGSGEFSVVRIVSDIFDAPDSSLILLDEPEVSLHPGAQERLLEFLVEMVKDKKHQVVISTHSPTFVRNLPSDAIKLLTITPDNKVSIINQETVPEMAFFQLGEPIAGKLIIVVEDELASLVVKKALKTLGKAIFDAFDVRYFPGGANTLWNSYIAPYASEDRKDIFVIFDGDQKKSIPEQSTIPSSKNSTLSCIIKEFTGCDVKLQIDGGAGGGNEQQLVSMQRCLIDWAKKHVGYLPGIATPEQFIWENMARDSDADDIDKTATVGKSSENYKKRFASLAQVKLGIESYEKVTSEQILTMQQMQLRSVDDNNNCICTLTKMLRHILERKEIP